MLIYLATYPRCGDGLLRWLLKMNFGQGCDTRWDRLGDEGRRAERERLAADRSLHFVKTHKLPIDPPLPGEKAVQMLRHPGAAIASHHRVQNELRSKDRKLKKLITGSARGGRNWSSYHAAWEAWDAPLLRLRYEQAYADPLALLAPLAAFLDLPMPERPRAETLKQAHARDPERNPGAGPDGWKAVITGADLELLWAVHGPMAERLGYRPDGVRR